MHRPIVAMRHIRQIIISSPGKPVTYDGLRKSKMNPNMLEKRLSCLFSCASILARNDNAL